MFRTAELSFFLWTCQAVKTQFELLRENLYRNGLKGNRNYFELKREVRVTEGKITVNV